jgi:hypothetical protein
MARLALRLTVLLTSVAASVCLADDLVLVTYNSGYPLPGVATESTTIAVERRSSSSKPREADVDRYYAKIERLMSGCDAPGMWGSRMVDGPFVRAEIQLGERKYLLESPLVEKGRVPLPSPATELDKRCAAGLQGVLRLTLEQARLRLSSRSR